MCTKTILGANIQYATAVEIEKLPRGIQRQVYSLLPAVTCPLPMAIWVIHNECSQTYLRGHPSAYPLQTLRIV